MIDERLRELVTTGDAARASALVIETYGVEVFGYLMTLVRDEDLAGDAFSVASEDLFKAVLGFRGDSSVRTWFYTLARHAAYREARGQRRRGGERITLAIEALQAPVRSATAAFRRTEVRDEFSRLRDALSVEERELLLLRIDRNLSWQDIALIQNPDADEAELKRDIARCRKQFERTKEKLRALARKAGLLSGED